MLRRRGASLPPAPEPSLRFSLRMSSRRIQSRAGSDTPIAVLSQMRGPEDAVDAGYIDQVVEAGTAEAAAVAAARELAKLPQAAFAGNKRSVRRATIERMEAELAKL